MRIPATEREAVSPSPSPSGIDSRLAHSTRTSVLARVIGYPVWHGRILRTAVLLTAALLAALQTGRSCFALIGSGSPRIVKFDYDCAWLMTGIEPTHTFAGTLRWWTGPWCCELAPYYRPMTSLFFWLEYRAFGPLGLQGFTAVHLLSHVVMLLICSLFIAELLGWRRAMVAVVLYGLNVASIFGVANVESTFPAWKDSCDIWCAICYICSLWLFVRYLRSGRPWLGPLSIGAFLAAISFKEMAYTLPLAIVLILWYESRLRDRYRLALLYSSVALAAFAYRTWALRGLGFRNGTNGAWWHRTIIDLLGPPARHLLCGDSLPIAVALVLAALLLARRPARRRAALVVMGCGAAMFAVACEQMRMAPGDLVFELLAPEFWREFVLVAACMAMAVHFAARGSREQRFAYGWILATHLPLMANPVGEHGIYLVAVGWSIWFAEALASGARMAMVGLRELMPRRSAVSLGSPAPVLPPA